MKKTIQPEVCSPEVLIKAIRESFIGSEQVYTQGSCIMFFRILKRVYPDAVPYWSKKASHMITGIGGKFYDITGKVKRTPDYEADDQQEYGFVSIAVALPKSKTRKWTPTTLTKITDL